LGSYGNDAERVERSVEKGALNYIFRKFVDQFYTTHNFMGLFKRNPFGHILFIKKWLIRIFAVLTHRRYRGFNELQIEGSEIIKTLPDTNVLFISNHQTYFADVVAMFHVFNASLSGREDTIKNIGYIWQPKMNIYYVAAKETMEAGLLPRILSYIGAITVERTWREKGKDVTEKREVNPNDTENIKIALNDGWVITFPQGTTKSFKPVRKGTAHIIKQHRPIVVPIVIDGFRRSFDKKGLRMKKKGILQSFIIKPPLEIDYENDTIEQICKKIEFAIEQHPSFLKVIPAEEIKAEEELNKLRKWEY
jgi:1-acyl-sn-glycerol-3-phosphate acyltransferase